MKIHITAAAILISSAYIAKAESNDYFSCLKAFSSRIEVAGKMEGHKKKSLGDVITLDGKKKVFIMNDKNEVFLIPYPEKAQINVVHLVASLWGPKGKFNESGEPEGEAIKSKENYLMYKMNGIPGIISLRAFEPYKNSDNTPVDYQFRMIHLLEDKHVKEVAEKGYAVSYPVGYTKGDKDRAIPQKIELTDYVAKDPEEVFTQVLIEKTMSFVDFRLKNHVDQKKLTCEAESPFDRKAALEEVNDFYLASMACQKQIKNGKAKTKIDEITVMYSKYISDNNLKLADGKIVMNEPCNEKIEKINSSSRHLIKEKTYDNDKSDVKETVGTSKQ